MPRLRKSERERVLFGVSGGIGEYFELDPVFVRVGFIALCFAGGIGVVLYLALAIVMPRAGALERTPAETVQDNVAHIADETIDAGRRLGAAMGPVTTEQRRSGLGILLIAVGAIILLANIGLFFWWRWDIFWAALLIGAGIIMVKRRARPSA